VELISLSPQTTGEKMYQEYFGFAEKPFSETPNPKFFYLSAKHREGLAHLEYNILDGKGFTALIGEVGTGKTTLCRALMDRLDGEKVHIAHIIHTNLDFHEFLMEVVEELGITSQGQDKWDLLKALKQFLIKVYAQNRKVILIVDEAQNLAPSVLEGIRMLSNLETPQEKLIQIVLVGQPGLMGLIKRPDMLQLKQRIAGSFYLEPLSAKETREYILFRLRCVQDKPVLRFTPEALDLICRLSEGIPRLINFLCDYSLMEAFVAESWTVDPLLVQKAHGDLTGSKDLEEQAEKKENEFQKKIEGRRKREESWRGAVMAGPIKTPDVPFQNVGVEIIPPLCEERFLFTEKKSTGKKIAVALGLLFILGGLGSLIFWDLNLGTWRFNSDSSSGYQVKIPVSELGTERQLNSVLSEQKLSKMTYKATE
jgi:type II secretory pathway predicted ATPase ExeA